MVQKSKPMSAFFIIEVECGSYRVTEIHKESVETIFIVFKQVSHISFVFLKAVNEAE
jgi:hypothetical protein